MTFQFAAKNLFALLFLFSSVQSAGGFWSIFFPSTQPVINGSETSVRVTTQFKDNLTALPTLHNNVNVKVTLSSLDQTGVEESACTCQKDINCLLEQRINGLIPSEEIPISNYNLKQAICRMNFEPHVSIHPKKTYRKIDLWTEPILADVNKTIVQDTKLDFVNNSLNEDNNFNSFHWSDVPCTKLCEMKNCNVTFAFTRSANNNETLGVKVFIDFLYGNPTSILIL